MLSNFTPQDISYASHLTKLTWGDEMALINDGLLQLRLLTAEELLPALLTSVFSGEKNKNVVEATLPWLEITAPHDITFNLDGEPLAGKHFRIEIIPNAIGCRLPPNCELLG